MFRFSLFFFLLLGGVLITSCNDDEVEVPEEEEVITTLTYTLTPVSGGDAVVLKFSDPDGDGGNAPTITTDALQANTQYNGVMELLNESESPAENITEEIQEEDEEHQFFFTSEVAGLTVAYADMDSQGKPVGLATTLQTGDAGSGNLTVVLRHEPDKGASGVADGDPTNAGGETDIEVVFSIDVQ